VEQFDSVVTEEPEAAAAGNVQTEEEEIKSCKLVT